MTRTTLEKKTTRRVVPKLAILLGVIYSTILNLRLPKNENQPIGLPSLPLRHSHLFNLLPHLIYESLLISQLSSYSTFNSFGACLHLLKFPLLSTSYKYFNIGFKSEICKSICFDLINYVGQIVLYSVFSNRTIESMRSTKMVGEKEDEVETVTEEEEEIKQMDKLNDQQEEEKRRNLILMSLLIWILISLMDGVFNFVLEKILSPKIQFDVQEYINKQELDEYFLLKSSGTTPRPGEILRAIPPTDRTMVEHQVISPLINLPYFFSSASLISLPSDLILLDRLPMLSLNTKLVWLFGLFFRRILNSTLAYFLKS